MPATRRLWRRRSATTSSTVLPSSRITISSKIIAGSKAARAQCAAFKPTPVLTASAGRTMRCATSCGRRPSASSTSQRRGDGRSMSRGSPPYAICSLSPDQHGAGGRALCTYSLTSARDLTEPIGAACQTPQNRGRSMMQELFIGVDVAKDWLDVHHSRAGARRIDNTPGAARSFAKACIKDGAWVIFEASGGYDRVLREALERANVPFSRVNPRQARDFARAMAVIGKTDRVDARMLSERGARLRPAATEPRGAGRRAPPPHAPPPPPSKRRRRAAASSWRCASRRRPASSRRRTPKRAPTSAACSSSSTAAFPRSRSA